MLTDAAVERISKLADGVGALKEETQQRRWTDDEELLSMIVTGHLLPRFTTSAFFPRLVGFLLSLLSSKKDEEQRESEEEVLAVHPWVALAISSLCSDHQQLCAAALASRALALPPSFLTANNALALLDLVLEKTNK